MRKFSGFAGIKSVVERVIGRLYVHPTRFYGDLQREGIRNWHRKVADFTDRFPPPARILDLGSGDRRIQGSAIAFDIQGVPDVLGDGHYLPFRDSCFDAIILQSVLEHVREPERVVSEVHRVLKAGGAVFCEVPFLYPVHDASDFRRWTEAGLRSMFHNFTVLESGASMGPFAALSAVMRRTFTLPVRSSVVDNVVDLVVGWLLAPIKHLDRFLRPADAALAAGAVFVVAEV